MNILRDNRNGAVLFVVIMTILSIFLLIMGMIHFTSYDAGSALNYKHKIQSFYASDAQMTLLSQELLDGNKGLYFTQINQNTTLSFRQLNAELPTLEGVLLLLTAALPFPIPPLWFLPFVPLRNGSLYEQLTWIGIPIEYSGDYNIGLRYSTPSSAGSDSIPMRFRCSFLGTIVDTIIPFHATGGETKYDTIWLSQRLADGLWNFTIYSQPGQPQVNIERMYIATGGKGEGLDTIGNYAIEWNLREQSRSNFAINVNSTRLHTSEKYQTGTNLVQKLNVPDDRTWILEIFPFPRQYVATVYDFHSDRSNPEFEQCHKVGTVTGMVQPRLDKYGKPVLGTNENLNRYIQYWFRNTDTMTEPVSRYPSNRNFKTCPPLFSDDRVANPGTPSPAYGQTPANAAFENRVIPVALTFIITGDNRVFFFSPQFHPIDNLLNIPPAMGGFGALEWNVSKNCQANLLTGINNFSWTMEFKHTFIMRKGLYFNYTGDDDAWIFINGKLVADMGGLHDPFSRPSANIDFDDIPGLELYHEYEFALFHCERHSPGSYIMMETNILLPDKISSRRHSWSRDYNLHK